MIDSAAVDSTYNRSRIPGWTDRIFAKKTTGLRLVSYGCEYNVMGCDHRPVLANYEIKLNKDNSIWINNSSKTYDSASNNCQLIWNTVYLYACLYWLLVYFFRILNILVLFIFISIFQLQSEANHITTIIKQNLLILNTLIGCYQEARSRIKNNFSSRLTPTKNRWTG